VAVLAFVVLFALTQPPAVHALANRVAPWILGLPFLYAYLLSLYVLLIGVLLLVLRRGI
jgi:choline-glycine betaine transporter